MLCFSALFMPGAPGIAHAADLSLGEGGVLQYDYIEMRGNSVTQYFSSSTLDNEQGNLVAEERDIDGDGDGDLWTVFKQDVSVLEAHDTTDNNVPDTFYIISNDDSYFEPANDAIIPADAQIDRDEKSQPQQLKILYLLLLLVVGYGLYRSLNSK